MQKHHRVDLIQNLSFYKRETTITVLISLLFVNQYLFGNKFITLVMTNYLDIRFLILRNNYDYETTHHLRHY